jgi:hypothetical protein
MTLRLAGYLPLVGTRPPGIGQLTTIVGWVTFLVGVALIVAFIVSLGRGGFSALRHGQYEGGTGPLVALICGVFLSASGALFGALGITI